MKIGCKPNLTWVVLPLLIAGRLMGLYNTWVAVGLLVVYVVIYGWALSRNPEIKREMREAADRTVENRQQKRKQRIANILEQSVKISRKK